MICECGGYTVAHYHFPDTQWCQRCGLLQNWPTDLRDRLDREQRMYEDGKRRYEKWATAQAERIAELAKQLGALMLHDLTDKEFTYWLQANRKRPSWVRGGDTALAEILSGERARKRERNRKKRERQGR